MDRGPEATERRGGGQSPVASRLALLWTLRTGSWTGRGETQPSQQPRLRSGEAEGDYLTDDEEADDLGSQEAVIALERSRKSPRVTSGLRFLQERLPEVLLTSIPANYATSDTPPGRQSHVTWGTTDDRQMMAENVANESIEAAADSWWARLAALLVPLGSLLYPALLLIQFVANTRAEISDWLFPQPEPVLRRSRRLRGLPPDVVEEMKRQRRIRQAKKQLPSSQVPAPAPVPVADGTPDRDLTDSDEEERER